MQSAAVSPTSMALADQVQNHVLHRLSGRLRGLQVIVLGQGLILQGQARTYYVKQLAQHVAAEMSGLAVVANQIEVA